jgi:hypothetical protein
MSSRSLNSSLACLSAPVEYAAFTQRRGTQIAAASTDPSATQGGRVLADIGDKATPQQPLLCHSERLNDVLGAIRLFATPAAGARLLHSAAGDRWTATGAPCKVPPLIRRLLPGTAAPNRRNRTRAHLHAMSLRLFRICAAPRDRLKRGPNLIQGTHSTT